MLRDEICRGVGAFAHLFISASDDVARQSVVRIGCAEGARQVAYGLNAAFVGALGGVMGLRQVLLTTQESLAGEGT